MNCPSKLLQCAVRLRLPCSVLLVSREAAATRLGLDADDVDAIVHGASAWRDGRTWSEEAFIDAYPDDDFSDFTCADVLPSELCTDSIELPRDPRVRLEPPITHEDVRALAIARVAASLARLLELGAPSSLLRHAKSTLQAAVDPMDSPRWQPLSELQTGSAPPKGAGGTPSAAFAIPWFGALGRADGSRVLDCAFIEGGLLVQLRYGSAILDAHGAILDIFPTCGLRLVGSTARHLAFVSGGGATATSASFGARLYVRDRRTRAWLTGAIPDGLPRFVAGRVADVKWTIVVDTAEGRAYRMDPYSLSDAGSAFNSACGRYVWDGSELVLEAETGAPVVDVRGMDADPIAFARGGEGWRFVVDPWRDEDEEDEEDEPVAHVLQLRDEQGRVLRELQPTAVALSPDATKLLVADETLRIVAADTGAALGPALDLQPLRDAFRLPEDTEAWRHMVAPFGYPAALDGMDPESVVEAMQGQWGAPDLDSVRAELAKTRRSTPVPRELATSNAKFAL